MHCSSCLPFDILRNDHLTHTICALSISNEDKIMIDPHLNKCTQSGWGTFKQYSQQEANDHCFVAKESQLLQLTNDSAALKSKHECQVFGEKNSDREFDAMMLQHCRSRGILQANQMKFLS